MVCIWLQVTVFLTGRNRCDQSFPWNELRCLVFHEFCSSLPSLELWAERPPFPIAPRGRSHSSWLLCVKFWTLYLRRRFGCLCISREFKGSSALLLQTLQSTQQFSGTSQKTHYRQWGNSKFFHESKILLSLNLHYFDHLIYPLTVDHRIT